MVSHQRSCAFSTDSPTNKDEIEVTGSVKRPSLEITPVGHQPEKKMKIVLNGESLKEFVMSKQEIKIEDDVIQEKTSSLTVMPVQIHNINNNSPSPSPPATTANGGPVVKQVVRKRAPIFPFEPEDHYVPDNNSNNIICKNEIEPPPTAMEKRQGYCLRPFRETGQQRYICTVCGKHYTTMYNMRQHRNIHTGSGLHCCRYCGRSFTHKHVWEVSFLESGQNIGLRRLETKWRIQNNAFQIDGKSYTSVDLRRVNKMAD